MWFSFIYLFNALGVYKYLFDIGFPKILRIVLSREKVFHSQNVCNLCIRTVLAAPLPFANDTLKPFPHTPSVDSHYSAYVSTIPTVTRPMYLSLYASTAPSTEYDQCNRDHVPCLEELGWFPLYVCKTYQYYIKWRTSNLDHSRNTTKSIHLSKFLQ